MAPRTVGSATDRDLSNTLNTDTGPVEIETPYVITPWIVEVVEVLLGTPQDRIRVEQSGGETAERVYVPEESWPIDEGRELIFFLMPKANGAEPNTYRIWEVWEIEGNQVLPKNGMDPTMTYGALKNRIADELRNPIPTDASQKMIPLEQSPPGPLL